MIKIAGVILSFLVAYVGFNSYSNSSSMNSLIEKGTEIVNKNMN